MQENKCAGTAMRFGTDRRGSIYRAYHAGEIVAAWQEKGQGHEDAVARGHNCVLIPCSWTDAIILSAIFVRGIFAILTCCHYNGQTLSLYCGEAGRDASWTCDRARMLADAFYTARTNNGRFETQLKMAGFLVDFGVLLSELGKETKDEG